MLEQHFDVEDDCCAECGSNYPLVNHDHPLHPGWCEGCIEDCECCASDGSAQTWNELPEEDKRDR